MCASDLVSSQIWLDLPRDEHHFFLYVIMDDSHFGYRPKLLRKTLGYKPESTTTNPLVKGDHPGWHWMYSRVQLIICVWSLQNKLFCRNQQATTNLLLLLLMCLLFLVLTAAECSSQFVFCLSFQSCLTQTWTPKTCQFWHWVVCHWECSS
jgi:hypothetical protein